MTPTWRRTAANHFDTREDGARGTMRNPIDVLKLLTEKASVKGYTFERLYRNLYNPDFYLLAYKNIAASPGSMTTGADGLSIDNMCQRRCDFVILWRTKNVRKWRVKVCSL